MDYYGVAFTEAVKKEQKDRGSLGTFDTARDRLNSLGENELAFIAARDSFYMATVGENGWPYLQHRGGPQGFIRVADETTLAIADFRGNRQYISLGHLASDDRVALFMMDYTNRARLKLYAHACAVAVEDALDLAALVETPGYRGKIEHILTFKIAGYDWNCPQHIAERYTLADIKTATQNYRGRIAQLEAEVAALQKKQGD
ncbi:MAG: pyridoxamine 5'-phosphate oxidase family protein [Rhizobiaceae bacterium]